jgi:hypothetical protein
MMPKNVLLAGQNRRADAAQSRGCTATCHPVPPATCARGAERHPLNTIPRRAVQRLETLSPSGRSGSHVRNGASTGASSIVPSRRDDQGASLGGCLPWLTATACNKHDKHGVNGRHSLMHPSRIRPQHVRPPEVHRALPQTAVVAVAEPAYRACTRQQGWQSIQ